MATLIIEVFGWIGMIFILLAYLLITLKKLDSKSLKYHGMNLIGASLIAVNSVINGAYPAGALNIFWAFIAIYGLIQGLKK